MPIKNLTDREAAFPQVGVLRKGAAKQEGSKRPGSDLTYFRFTSEHADVLAAFQRTYGDKPIDVNVFLPYRTTDENFSAWREHWVAGGLVHRCDGENCVVHRTKDGTYSTEPEPCPGGCKPVGRLSVVVPELKRLAFVTAQTTSLHDIITLTENMQALEMITGDLRGIPLILRRRPRKVSTPEIYPKGHAKQYKPTGKRVRREKWLLTLEAAPQWVALQLAAQQAAAIPRLEDGSLPELMAPEDDNHVTIDGHTGEIIDTAPDPMPESSHPMRSHPAADEPRPPPDDGPLPYKPVPTAVPIPEEIATGSEPDPVSPKDLLITVNDTTTGYYNHLKHLLGAIRIELGAEDWNWPDPYDREAWNEAYTVAVAHAEKESA